MTNNPPINTSLATGASKILLRRLHNSSNENTVDFNVEVDDYIVGSMQLTSIVPHQTAQLNIYSRDEIYWENGVVEVAVYQLLVCAKEVLKLQSVYVEYIKENNAAVQLYQKNGFVPHNSSSDFFTSVCLLEKVPPPMVSVFCLVYNHEKFIGEAIEGFLMQKTNFTTQIVLGEDCSSDGSRAVILEYAHKYPGKFKLLLHDTNIGALNNQQMVFEHCDGNYIAMCEGDDYWTDPYKLQKQVDFLEENDEYSFSFHDSIELHQSSGEQSIRIGNRKIDTVVDLKSIITENNFPTASLVFRSSAFPKTTDILCKTSKGDYALVVQLAEKGLGKFFSEVMCAYRIHDGGVWNSSSIEYKLAENLKFYDLLYDYFEEPSIKKVILQKRNKTIESLSLLSLREGNFWKGMNGVIKHHNFTSDVRLKGASIRKILSAVKSGLEK